MGEQASELCSAVSTDIMTDAKRPKRTYLKLRREKLRVTKPEARDKRKFGLAFSSWRKLHKIKSCKTDSELRFLVLAQ